MPRRHLPDEFRFDARYGRLIRKAGIGTVPFALFAYQAEMELQPQEVWFIAYILAHRWTADLPFPSLAQMARNSGLTKRALRNYKDSLVAKGYLVVVERYRADGGTTSHGYDFSPLFDILDRCITRDLDRWAHRNPQFLEEDADVWDDEPAATFTPEEQVYPLPGEQDGPGAGKRRLTGRRKGVTLGPGQGASPQEVEGSSKGTRNKEQGAQRQDGDGISTGLPPLGVGNGAHETAVLRPVQGNAADDLDRIADAVSGTLHGAPSSLKGTRTRIRGLWRESGLSQEKFVPLLYEALERTQRSSGNIRRPAGDGSLGLANKVPYFLRVLENLLAERQEEPVAVSSEPPVRMRAIDAPVSVPASVRDSRGRDGEEAPAQAVWSAALAVLQEQMTAGNFATWLQDTQAVRWQGDQLVVAAGDAFTRDWLTQRLAPVVRRTVRQITRPEADVVFVVALQEGEV